MPNIISNQRFELLLVLMALLLYSYFMLEQLPSPFYERGQADMQKKSECRFSALGLNVLFIKLELDCLFNVIGLLVIADKGLYVGYCFLKADLGVIVVNVDELVEVVAHAQLLHVAELAVTLAAFDALLQSVAVRGLHGVDKVNAGLVNSQQIERCADANIGSDNGLSLQAFTVTGDGHVAHNVYIADLLAEEVNNSLGGLDHALLEDAAVGAPLLALGGVVVDNVFANRTAGAANAQVLGRAAEAAGGVALEVGQGQQGVIVNEVLAHIHLSEPLAALDRQLNIALGIDDVYGRESPTVDLQGFQVLLGGAAVTVVEGVGLDDGSTLQLLVFKQLCNPGAGNNIGAVLFAGVNLDTNLALENLTDALEDLLQTCRAQITGKENNGLFAVALIDRKINAAINSIFHW